MRRFLLLLLIVGLIVVGLAWLIGPDGPISQVAPPPPGPGDAAWLNPSNLPSGQDCPGLHFV
jgi:hypothetical protein